jgi:hypothetical protein
MPLFLRKNGGAPCMVAVQPARRTLKLYGKPAKVEEKVIEENLE